MAATSDTAVPSADGRSAGLGLWDAVAIIVGIIIGATIFRFPPLIFSFSQGPTLGIAVWVIGGFFSLLGALCYAELATTYRTAGGDFTYLSRAFGPRVGFVYAWAELSVIRTGGSIAAMAYVFAEFAQQIEYLDLSLQLGQYTTLTWAAGAILVLAGINYLGMQPGRLTQNFLTAIKVFGLLGIIGVGFGWYFYAGPTGEPASATSPPGPPGLPPGMSAISAFALAMVFVFYAYGGWNEAAFVAAEVRNPRRNIVRALVLGVLSVTVIYVIVNLAYLAAFGYENVARSQTIASDLLALPLGDAGKVVMAVLVMISALGAINGLLFTGMRLYGTFGSRHRLFRWLADPQGRPEGSKWSLVMQAAFSLLLIGVIESAPLWKSALNNAGFPYTFNQGEDSLTGIEALIACTAPVFWTFFLMTGLSFFVLRWRDPHRERPFRVPLFPWVPLGFCSMCGFMLYKSLDYALTKEPAEVLVVIGLALVGVPLMLLSGRPHSEEPAT